MAETEPKLKDLAVPVVVSIALVAGLAFALRSLEGHIGSHVSEEEERRL